MTHEEIIRMAREAGLAHWDDMLQADRFTFALPERLERFAALVAAAEREACARICDEERKFWKRHEGRRDGAASCAKAIRARGKS